MAFHSIQEREYLGMERKFGCTAHSVVGNEVILEKMWESIFGVGENKNGRVDW